MDGSSDAAPEVFTVATFVPAQAVFPNISLRITKFGTRKILIICGKVQML